MFVGRSLHKLPNYPSLCFAHLFTHAQNRNQLFIEKTPVFRFAVEKLMREMIRDSRYEYGRGRRGHGYDRHRYSSGSTRRNSRSEEYANGNAGRRASGPPAAFRPAVPSGLYNSVREEAMKLVSQMKKGDALKEQQEKHDHHHHHPNNGKKKNSNLSKRSAGGSDASDGELIPNQPNKKHRSSRSAEKNSPRKRSAASLSPSTEIAHPPKKKFNPFHEVPDELNEDDSDDANSNSPQDSEEYAMAMARRKSRWEIQDEQEKATEIEVDQKAEEKPVETKEKEFSESDEEEESGVKFDMRKSARIVDEYTYINKISEGTYGIVFRGRNKKTGKLVALKKMKVEKEREGYPLTSLREINILTSLNHPNIVNVSEVVVSSSGNSVFLVMEYLEHDLKRVSDLLKHRFTVSHAKCIMHQLISGVAFLHENWIIHRDLKFSNVLYNNKGDVKLCDFGMARQYGSPLHPYTQLVVTLWYRAPELLLGTKVYSTAVDVWSLGCIMGELLQGKPMFPGENEISQMSKIFDVTGAPNEEVWPGVSALPNVGNLNLNGFRQRNSLREKFPETSFTGGPTLTKTGFDLLSRLLALDPNKRISAKDALEHPWFKEIPLPVSKVMLPTFGA